MKNKKIKRIFELHPVMTFMLLTLIIMVISTFLFLFNVQSTYNLFSMLSMDYSPVTESVIPLLNLSGLKYIFTNSVSNFANYKILTNLIIILIGIGIMDKSGFLQTTVTLLTKKAKKTNVTFTIMLVCLLSGIFSDLAFVIFIPLFALFFYYGKRNPFIGIIASFGALTIGNSISIIFTSIDSALRNTTVLNASSFQLNYEMSIYSLIFISFIVILLSAFLLTRLTENVLAKKMPKFEFSESALEEDIVTRKELRGIILSVIAGILYLLIVIYNIIPGLPFSGNLLDNSQSLYIDKLFSYESFFSNGFVFIITMFFIVLGLVYGIGSRSIKNNRDFVENLGHSLDGIGKTLLLIFVSSILISVFKQTNLGNTTVTYLANLIVNFNFTGLPLVLLLLVITVISTIFLPSTLNKWVIIASVSIPAFMDAGLTPEFAQIVYRLGEAVSLNITPLFPSFIIYLAYLEKYNQEDKTIGIFEAIKYQLPYSLLTFIIVIIIITLFFVTNIPLGIGGAVAS